MEHERKCVLVVDDSEINRGILNKILSADYSVLEAKDGAEAMNIIQNRCDDIDLLMLDLLMPQVSGWDVLTFMKDRDLMEKLPVIVISGEDDDDLIQKAYDMGAVDYVAKPFSLKIVKQRVMMAVS